MVKQRGPVDFDFSKLTIVLVLLCVVSAIAVVVMRHENRLAFVEMQKQQAENDRLQIEWGRLKLEYATWSATHQLSDEAKAKFDMLPPAPEDIVTIQLPGDGRAAVKLEVQP